MVDLMTPSKQRARNKRTPKKARRAAQTVYSFGANGTDGNRELRNLLGGKGANLAEMSNLGLPVPPGFTISTEVCTHYSQHDGGYPAQLAGEVDRALAKLEAEMLKRFGDPENPLLVSVRSGARVSMPGMMDTVLNLGLNDATVEGLARRSQNPRFAWDAYRRFVQMYGDVVLGIGPDPGEEESPFGLALDALKKKRRVESDTDLSAKDLQGLVATFKAIVKRRTKRAFPEDPREAAVGRHRRGVRLLEQRAGHRLPAHERHPRRLGHRGQRPGHGVRQPGRGLRHRRGLHARPRHRREALLRRVPDQRPG